MGFLYETHMHTTPASACGKSTGKEHVHFYRDIGFTGIIITDHFFRGNTGVDRSLPWEQRIDLYCRGYEEAREEGEKIGLDVFFGIEENHAGDEYLIYGLDKAFLKAHPEMEHWTRRQQLEEVHRAGGCVIQAHPFRMRKYMDRIRVGLPFCDGIEAANAGNEPLDDARAIRLGREKHLVMTAGSDNHLSPTEKIFGIELENRLTNIGEYVRIILNHEKIGLHVPESRFDLPDPVEIDERHEAYLLDEAEREYRAPKEWID